MKQRRIRGRIEWTENDELHREDGPAVIWPDQEEYYIHGKRHREDGPAIEHLYGGYQAYFINGKKHRIDGPAVIHAFGDKEYWINGNKLTKKEFDMYRFVNEL